jgi:hypothetical protein
LTKIKAASGDGWFHPRSSNVEVAAITNIERLETLRTGVVAGAAGGLTGIAWMTLYVGLTGINPRVVAQSVIRGDAQTAERLCALYLRAVS